MPPTHVVRPGECLTQIAHQYGFADYEAVYGHPDNADLRQKRPDPNILHPGDEVVIPDREKKQVSCSTGSEYTFTVKRPTRKLKLQLQDAAGKPIASVSYSLVGDGVSIQKKTTSAGLIEADLPIFVTQLEFTVGRLTRTLHVGHLNPLRDTDDDGVSGLQARLANLGFNPGSVDGVYGPRTASAIAAFQRAKGMDETGQIDDALVAALQSDHGC